MLIPGLLARFLAAHRSPAAADGAAAVYRCSDGVRSSAHERGVVLFHTHTGKLLQANRTGALIWELIQLSKTPAEIAAQIAAMQGVTWDQTWRDTAAFLAVLEEAQLIYRAGQA